MSATDHDTTDPRRTAIEEELRARLALDRGVDPPPATPGLTPLRAVGLLCLACRGLSSGDAHFCTKCGVKFNALVVATGHPDSTRGGAA